MKTRNMNSVLKRKWPAKKKKVQQSYRPVTTESYYNVTEPFYRLPVYDILRYGNNSMEPHAHNEFQKKTNMLTGIHKPHTKSQSFTVVVTIGGIFLFLTMAITAAVVIFCRKKNSVFALQKSEQGTDYEMDEFSDTETGEGDIENDLDSSPLRSKRSSRRSSRHSSHKSFEYTGSVHQPLVLPTACYDSEDSPIQYRRGLNKSSKPANYQKMVVTAVLEKPISIRNTTSLVGSDESDTEMPKKYLNKDTKMYYKVSGVPSDVDSDITDQDKCEKSKDDKKFQTASLHFPLQTKYSDDPPSYDSLSLAGKQVVVNLQNCNCLCHAGCKDFKTNCSVLETSKNSSDYKPLPPCNGATALPPDNTKKKPPAGLVVVLPIKENKTEINRHKELKRAKRQKKRTSGGIFAGNRQGYYYQRPEEHDNDAYTMEPDRFSI